MSPRPKHRPRSTTKPTTEQPTEPLSTEGFESLCAEQARRLVAKGGDVEVLIERVVIAMRLRATGALRPLAKAEAPAESRPQASQASRVAGLPLRAIAAGMKRRSA